MEMNAVIEQMSGLQTRSYDDNQGQKQTVDYLTIVLNNGLERIVCETSGSGQAKSIVASGIKQGDHVQAMLITWAGAAKTKEGREFLTNRTSIVRLQKDYYQPEIPQTF